MNMGFTGACSHFTSFQLRRTLHGHATDRSDDLLQLLGQLNAAFPTPVDAVLYNCKVVLNLQKVLVSAELQMQSVLY